jgi:hypothetical protein
MKRKKIEREIIKSLDELTKKLEKGEDIEVTEIKREQTPDGPLHTFKKKKIRRETSD